MGSAALLIRSMIEAPGLQAKTTPEVLSSLQVVVVLPAKSRQSFSVRQRLNADETGAIELVLPSQICCVSMGSPRVHAVISTSTKPPPLCDTAAQR